MIEKFIYGCYNIGIQIDKSRLYRGEMLKWKRSGWLNSFLITFAITGIAWGGLAVLTNLEIISFSPSVRHGDAHNRRVWPDNSITFCFRGEVYSEIHCKIRLWIQKKSMVYVWIFAIMEILVFRISL